MLLTTRQQTLLIEGRAVDSALICRKVVGEILLGHFPQSHLLVYVSDSEDGELLCWALMFEPRLHVKCACDGVGLFRDVPVTRWMTNGCLKTVLSGLLPLPGETGGRPSVPFSHIILFVLIYRLWRHTTETRTSAERSYCGKSRF